MVREARSALCAVSFWRFGGGASRSRARPVEPAARRRRLVQGSPAISRCVRPLVSARRTASASNSLSNPKCGLPKKCCSRPSEKHPVFGGTSHRVMPRPGVKPVQEETGRMLPLRPFMLPFVRPSAYVGRLRGVSARECPRRGAGKLSSRPVRPDFRPRPEGRPALDAAGHLPPANQCVLRQIHYAESG